MMEMTLNSYYTLVIAVITLLIGRQLVQRIQLLNRFNIPEPVAGGLLGSLLLLTAYILFDFTVRFDSDLQTAFMLVFFASLGLSASLGKLKAGGSPLVKFLIIIVVFLVLQNFISLGLGYFLGLDPFLSLVAGSISLMGGHGTAAAWGNVLETDYGIQGAIALGMACATFGLVIGGIVGSPLANRLIKKNNLSSSESIDSLENRDIAAFEVNRQVKLITASNAVETLALFAICLAFADFMTVFARGTWFELPTFVWALMAGVVVRNILESIFKVNMFERSIDVFGNAALSMFLVMALLSLRLWEIADLAAPLIILLTLQTIFMIIYIWFITFRFMGKDYDAAVLSAGHGGFGTGATPTAIANMQSITDRYGPSYKAFLIVPIVGAFFIDIVNAAMIQITLKVLSTFI